MEKYKICPACGHHNAPYLLECEECETDLQSAPVMDEALEQAASQNTSTEAPVAAMVRLCDCGAKNPVQARRCNACGEDISVIAPTPDTAATESVRYILSSLDGVFAYEIPEGVTCIGREQEMSSYLADKPFVSRKHAELTLDTTAATLQIQNRSTTNFTFVNNRLLTGDMSVQLQDGDEIGLGGHGQNGTRQPEAAYFLVRIGQCT